MTPLLLTDTSQCEACLRCLRALDAEDAPDVSGTDRDEPCPIGLLLALRRSTRRCAEARAATAAAAKAAHDRIRAGRAQPARVVGAQPDGSQQHPWPTSGTARGAKTREVSTQEETHHVCTRT